MLCPVAYRSSVLAALLAGHDNDLRYYWADGSPAGYSVGLDCSGAVGVFLVLLGAIPPDHPDTTADGWRQQCTPGTGAAWDLAFYGSASASHVGLVIGHDADGVPLMLHAGGGDSTTRGDNPDALVKVNRVDYRSDLLGYGAIPTTLEPGPGAPRLVAALALCIALFGAERVADEVSDEYLSALDPYPGLAALLSGSTVLGSIAAAVQDAADDAVEAVADAVDDATDTARDFASGVVGAVEEAAADAWAYGAAVLDEWAPAWLAGSESEDATPDRAASVASSDV